MNKNKEITPCIVGHNLVDSNYSFSKELQIAIEDGTCSGSLMGVGTNLHLESWGIAISCLLLYACLVGLCHCSNASLKVWPHLVFKAFT